MTLSRTGRVLTQEEEDEFIKGVVNLCPFCESGPLHRVYPPRQTNGRRDLLVLLECQECRSLIQVLYRLHSVLMSQERSVS
jgi:hypothetical protein